MPVTVPIRAATPTTDTVVLTTIPNVELLEVGEDWETSTGTFTWDVADLQAAIESQADPGIRTPIVKLGHTDPRFDGQPSIGRIENLRTTNNGQTLVGDLVGVPVWLAKVMGSAFPRRSIEGWMEFTSRTGNTWPFVLTGVALLGAAYPAIDTLEDIKAIWGEDPPTLVPASDVPEVIASAATPRGTRIVAVRRDDVPTWRNVRAHDNGGTPAEEGAGTVPQPQPVAAGTSVDDIRRAYYESLDQNQFWWWIREVRVDPPELIVDDDEGGLYRVTYSIANDEVTFSDPQKVKIEYIDVTASAGFRVAAKWGTPEESGRRKRPDGEGSPATPAVSATITTPEREEKDVKLSDDALRALGLDPATATEDEINAAIVARTTPDPTATGDGDGDGGSGGTPPAETAPTTGDGDPQSQPTTPATDPTGEPATAPTTTPPADGGGASTTSPTPEGMVMIDQATLDQLKQGVAAASTLVEKDKKANRDRILDDAIRAGKFPPSRRAHYENMLLADPEGGAATIASLAAGLIPVTERGTQGGEMDPPVDSAYPEAWKPAVAAARKGVGARVKVVND